MKINVYVTILLFLFLNGCAVTPDSIEFSETQYEVNTSKETDYVRILSKNAFSSFFQEMKGIFTPGFREAVDCLGNNVDYLLQSHFVEPYPEFQKYHVTTYSKYQHFLHPDYRKLRARYEQLIGYLWKTKPNLAVALVWSLHKGNLILEPANTHPNGEEIVVIVPKGYTTKNAIPFSCLN